MSDNRTLGTAEGLAAAMALLEQELERLQLDLETQRLLSHPNREQAIQALIADIDYRQDQLAKLEELRAAAES